MGINALAIAAVTAVLKNLMENALVRDSLATVVGDVIVTALPPDRISIGADERAQINLFLYQVTQNRNADWVSRERISARHNHPPLALDLHYILTAYGTKDFQSELLLGYVMQLFHDMPILTQELIHTALQNATKANTSSVLSQALGNLSVSQLASQLGQIKISPEFYNMEETSKIWSALQTHYRPSAVYQASMVLLESRHSNSSSPPFVPWRQPMIEQVIAPPAGGQLIVSGSTLIIRGKRLRSDVTRIRLLGSETLLVPTDVEETQISLPLPPHLLAGVQGVQVVHLKIGTVSPDEIESNVAAFVLHPTITVSVEQVQDSGSGLRSANITVRYNPKVGKMQRVVLLLNQVSQNGSVDYSFVVTPQVEDTDSITIPVKNVLAGTYLVRVHVDGAQSSLSINKAGEYVSPQVIIP